MWPSYFTPKIILISPPGGGATQQKFYKGRFRSEVQPLSLLYTVEPGYDGHQGDTPKCPYYPGVRIIRVSVLSGCPYYPGVRIIRVSVLSGCQYYPGVRIIRVSVLSGCPYYPGVRIIRVSVLSGCPYYPGVRIIRASVLSGLSETDTSRTRVLSIQRLKQAFLTETKRV